jgi:tripartite-type tricarboxylate transporter receptor subunit TctC
MAGPDLLRHAKPLLAGFCFATALALCASAQAQTYPNKPIRLIVPWPAGGGVDTSARIVAQPLSERLGQPIVIENKPGAGGNIGTAVVAQEKADGYTLLMGSAAPHGINPHLYTHLGFAPIDDFAFVGHVYDVPSFLVVPANSPYKSAKDLVAAAKANPGKLNFGSGGIGSSQHLFGVMFTSATGIDVVHVAYKGTSPLETALVAGQVDFALDPPTCLPFIDAGKLRVLGVASKVRNAVVPDIPTLDEQGITDVYTSTYYGILAPAKTPREVVDKLNKEINAVLSMNETKSRMAKMAAEPGKGTPDEFKAFAIAEIERYAKVVKQSGAGKVD